MIYLYLIMDFAELMRLGYGPKFLEKSWKTAASDLGTWEIGEAALDRLKTIFREARCCLSHPQEGHQCTPSSGARTISLEELLPHGISSSPPAP